MLISSFVHHLNSGDLDIHCRGTIRHRVDRSHLNLKRRQSLSLSEIIVENPLFQILDL